jgi:hypothetical protein
LVARAPFEAAPGPLARRVFAERCEAVFGMLDSLACAWINPRLPTRPLTAASQWTVAQRVGCGCRVRW